MQSDIDSFKRYQTVNIGFINSDEKEDETQFDITGAGSRSGERQIDYFDDEIITKKVASIW